MTDWKPIETAPKNGSVVLVYCEEGIEIDEHAWQWPAKPALHVSPARWHNGPIDTGWVSPFFEITFGPYDDPSTDIDPVFLEPTHWMPMPHSPAR